MTNLLLPVRGPYALEESRRFLCGFTPAKGAARASGEGDLELAFLEDQSFLPVVARVRQHGATVTAEVSGGADPGRTGRQLARILSLDHDGTEFARVAERDPHLAPLLAARPGFRPVCFASSYEAAAWGILAQRCPMPLAARMKQEIARRAGESVEAFGQRWEVFPSPERLLSLREVPSLPEEKMTRLHGIARAALGGLLDPDHLRRMPPEEALVELEALRGVGGWTAQHILMRGSGTADALPTLEPRVFRALALSHGLPGTPDLATLRKLSEPWRPFRMWVCVLLVSHLGGTPGWHGPEPRGRKPRRQMTLDGAA